MDPSSRETFYNNACATKGIIAEMEKAFGPVVVGEWSLATDNCAMWLNGVSYIFSYSIDDIFAPTKLYSQDLFLTYLVVYSLMITCLVSPVFLANISHVPNLTWEQINQVSE